MSKSILKSKTFWFNTLTTAGTLLGTYGGLLGPAALPYIVGATGIINVALRFITSQPVTLKGGDAGF